MLLAYLAVAPLLFQQPVIQRVPSMTGDVTVIRDFESKILGNKRNLIVYLPPDYKTNPSRRYPVLYCHDGQNVFDGATSYIANHEWRIDEAAESLIKAGLIEPLIIVAVANAGYNRSNEYLPTKIKLGNGEYGGRADNYGKFLLEEVKAYVDKTYRTKPGGKDTSMLGSSFGGVITYYLGMTHPGKFSKLAVMSPSVWVNDRELIKRTDALTKKLNFRIWIDIGSLEGGEHVQNASDLVKSLETKGWRLDKDLVFFEDNFAGHNEDYWARRVPAVLMWMFGKR